MSPEDYIFQAIEPFRYSQKPLGIAEFVGALNSQERSLPHRQRAVYEGRESALQRARVRDAATAKKMKEAGAEPHASHVWLHGEEADLRREYGFPPRLVHDMGGKGTAARIDVLLGIVHLRHCLQHPLCADHFGITEAEIAAGLDKLSVILSLVFGGEIRAAVWTRIVNPWSATPYRDIGEPVWTPCSAFIDFFGSREPRALLAGFDMGLMKVRYEIGRDSRFKSAKELATRRGVRNCLGMLYGLPLVYASTPGTLWSAEENRALHILLDGFPSRFLRHRTALAVNNYIRGASVDEEEPIESFILTDTENPTTD
ncbi:MULTISPECIES: hypothetical protein [Hydrocarboniphaga]|uniref:hypothetical protein n=1 Tax=Hydrocarboniphaga TaxID=243627 RepID=UPI0012F8A737|nr:MULTISPECIES: hypothetical protein [Hydrocarboniphaga]MDZ4077410.1 hypothetical protein [Hydrocarboniphaga sp.]